MLLILLWNSNQRKQLEYFGHQKNILLCSPDLTTNYHEQLVEIFKLDEYFGLRRIIIIRLLVVHRNDLLKSEHP